MSLGLPLGYKAVQIPSWDKMCINLTLAAESKSYADEIMGIVNNAGLEMGELSSFNSTRKSGFTVATMIG